jgi:hypothetical protein
MKARGVNGDVASAACNPGLMLLVVISTFLIMRPVAG